jgi:hypothetical protein
VAIGAECRPGNRGPAQVGQAPIMPIKWLRSPSMRSAP